MAGATRAFGIPSLRAPAISTISADLPQTQDINRLNVIHVAGTKGKGSTCAFIEAFLRAHGHRTGYPRKTGLYTSPHLMVLQERIRLNSKPLPEDLFAQYAFEVFQRLPQLAELYDPAKDPVARGPRYLQLLALLAFHVFLRQKVDVAILETHCGGEYDATNIVQAPLVTAISTLDMDHIDMLGPTIESIAWHKAGIIKRGAVALSAPQVVAARKVLEDRALEKEVHVRFVGIDERLSGNSPSLQPNVQKGNASLAAASAEAFLARKAPLDHQYLTFEDMAAAVNGLDWPGRFQTIQYGNFSWFLDSAHNDVSVVIAAQWFAEAAARSERSNLPRMLIFSHINELRDAASLLKTLGTALQQHNANIEHVIFSTYNESNETKSHSLPEKPDLFRGIWASISPKSKIWNEPTIEGAVALARRLQPEGMMTLITGSQHLVGPALRVLGWKSDAKCSDETDARRASN